MGSGDQAQATSQGCQCPHQCGDLLFFTAFFFLDLFKFTNKLVDKFLFLLVWEGSERRGYVSAGVLAVCIKVRGQLLTSTLSCPVGF